MFILLWRKIIAGSVFIIAKILLKSIEFFKKGIDSNIYAVYNNYTATNLLKGGTNG